jgi:hypothetical protein
VCIPDGYDCPVTGAESGSTLPSGYSDNYTMTTDDTSTNWYIRFEADGEMPINHVELVLYSPSSSSYGECFLGGENHESYSGRGKSYSYNNNYPKKCSKLDTRWLVLDYQTESDYLYENFINADDSCFVDKNVSDYILTGEKCGKDPLEDADCML